MAGREDRKWLQPFTRRTDHAIKQALAVEPHIRIALGSPSPLAAVVADHLRTLIVNWHPNRVNALSRQSSTRHGNLNNLDHTVGLAFALRSAAGRGADE